QEDGAHVRLGAIRPEGVGIREEARDVPETADRRIVAYAVEVVEVEADAEAVRVGGSDAEREQRDEHCGEPSAAEGRHPRRRTLARHLDVKKRQTAAAVAPPGARSVTQ